LSAADILSMQEERHTILQLGREDRVAQKTLQWLEGELRLGRHPADARNLREAVMQCVERNDLKVKRWALNTLAELGLAGRLEVLEGVFPYVADDPDLLASAVRLLFREARQGPGLLMLNRYGVSVEGLALIAGSEYSSALRKRLVDEKIPMDNASAEELRAAIVLTGRGKAPEHLFLARHANDIALSELNLHDDPSVVKYSLWGLAERRMGFAFLKINLYQYDDCEPQVRKWILRLLFSDPRAFEQNLDLISHCAKDEDVDVREEAAIGLRTCYVEEASQKILVWYRGETSEPVKLAIIDHFAKFSDRNQTYEKIVREIYEREHWRSDLRGRIEASVGGTELYKKLRVIELKEEAVGLFSNDNDMEGVFMPKIEQNFPNAQIGAVSGTGAISVENQTFNHGADPALVAKLCAELVRVASMVPDQELRRQGEALSIELKKEPSKGLVEKAIGWTKTVASASSAGAQLIHAGGDLVTQLDSLAGIM
jgi:hypothetical protein